MQNVNVSAFHHSRKLSLQTVFSSLMLFIVMPITSVQAACEDKGCACSPSEFQVKSSGAVAGPNGKFPISLEADSVSSKGKELVNLIGDAVVAQGNQSIIADEITYYRKNDRVVAKGNVEILSETGTYIRSKEIDVHAQTYIGDISEAEFKLAKSRISEEGIDTIKIDARGKADALRLEGEGLLRLEGAWVTRCPEGDDSVVVTAKEVELDQTEGVGRARNAIVRFKNVPLLYVPYLSFPINDERKTGFLTPSIGSDEDSGESIALPWYWNIAENQDATITPQYFTERGLQLAGEYRHQSRRSNTLIYAEILPGDDVFQAENLLEDGDRDMFSIYHNQDITDNLNLTVNFNDASDTEYFDDFNNKVASFSDSYIPQEAKLKYSHDYFKLSAHVKDIRIIDSFLEQLNTQYEIKPAIKFSTGRLPEAPLGIDYGLDASFTEFANDNLTEGSRMAISPYASLPLKEIWGYIEPGLTVHHRSYSLSNNPEGDEDSPSFTVPVFSIDGGLYFERNASWFGSPALQTLEPRIFYAYAPSEDQSDAPDFDTSAAAQNNFSGIFRANRFSGYDRVGDTNQVTVGVTTRFIDNESGEQRLKASIGQILYLDDREQHLTEGLVEDSSKGNLLAEMQTESGSWTTSTTLQYDHEESEVRSFLFGFGYEPDHDNRKEIGLSYYYFNNTIGDDTDQIKLAATWPLADRWQVFGSTTYSLEDSKSLFSKLGVEYDSCCWKARLVGQTRLTNNDINDQKSSVFIELELTSLGSFATGLY